MDTMTEQDAIQSIEDDLDERMMEMVDAAEIAHGADSRAGTLTLMAMVRALYLDAPEDAKEVADAILSTCTEEYIQAASELLIMDAKWRSVPAQYTNGIKC